MNRWTSHQKKMQFMAVLMLLCMCCLTFFSGESWKQSYVPFGSQPLFFQQTCQKTSISGEKYGVVLPHYLLAEKSFKSAANSSETILNRNKRNNSVRNIRTGIYSGIWNFFGVAAFAQGLFCILCFMLLRLYGRQLRKLWKMIYYIHKIDGKKQDSFFEHFIYVEYARTT